jgi:hypothetical protein
MVIHVECIPDETLLKKLGFTKKQIQHHAGKTRVLAHICKNRNQLAMVDEDPQSVPNPYEQVLQFEKEAFGIKCCLDKKLNNKVLVLKPKLEDWIISACKKSNIDLDKFGLPVRGNGLHGVINNRLSAYERLLDDLLQKKSEYLFQLKDWLNE